MLKQRVLGAFCVGVLLVGTGVVYEGVGAAADAPTSLNALQASDSELLKAVSDLDAQIADEQVQLSSAQSALDAANQSLGDDAAVMAAAQVRVNELKAIQAGRAVDEYMAPTDEQLNTFLGADGLAEAGRRAALLEQVTGNDDNSLDELKATESDLAREHKAAFEAQRIASDRQSAEQAKLDSLNKARADKMALDQTLKDRIESATAEDSAGARAGGSTAGRASRGSTAMSNDARISTAGLKWPVTGPIRSPFGPRWGTVHTGIDIGATEGTPIYAAKGGTVTSAKFDSGGYGNLVQIDIGGGVQTWYAHQSRIVAKPGPINQGDLIGYVGHTGHVVPDNAGAAHLHFEIRVNGSPVDPMQFLP